MARSGGAGIPSPVTRIIRIKICFPNRSDPADLTVCDQFHRQVIALDPAGRSIDPAIPDLPPLELLPCFRFFPFRSELIKRCDSQPRLPARPVYDPVSKRSRILPVFHCRLFHDLHTVYMESPHGSIFIRKFRKIAIPLLHFSVRRLLGGEYIFPVSDPELFRQTVDHIIPIVRRLCTRHKKGMVIPCHRPGHSHRRKSSQPIGHQITVLLSPLICLPILFSVHPFPAHTAFFLQVVSSPLC